MNDGRQTNNAAELVAVLPASHKVNNFKIFVATDLPYVFLGATGKAVEWR